MSQEATMFMLAFVSFGVIAYWISAALFKGDGNQKLRSRLQGKSETSVSVEKKDGGVGQMIKHLGEAAAKPFMPSTREKQSTLQKELGRAGIYSPSAMRSIQGAKVIGIGVGLLVGYGLGVLMGLPILGVAMGGLFGYVAPIIFVKIAVSSNQKALDYALPDALDLMVVCVEAGMTVDSAMQRVGDELALVHPALSREFGITHMQTRVGMARSEALKSLGTRTDNAPLTSLSAMLNQAERFGTSIAQALRVHADSMRVQRQHKAEEIAAKSAVKMTFPLVLFIFPATFIVLLGPVMIQLMNSELMK
jgi:tight adherence protein C